MKSCKDGDLSDNKKSDCYGFRADAITLLIVILNVNSSVLTLQ